MPRKTRTPHRSREKIAPEVALIRPEGRARACRVTAGGPWARVRNQDSLPTLTQDRSFLVTLESAIRTHPAYKLPFGDKMGQREKEWIAAGTPAPGPRAGLHTSGK